MMVGSRDCYHWQQAVSDREHVLGVESTFIFGFFAQHQGSVGRELGEGVPLCRAHFHMVKQGWVELPGPPAVNLFKTIFC